MKNLFLIAFGLIVIFYVSCKSQSTQPEKTYTQSEVDSLVKKAREDGAYKEKYRWFDYAQFELKPRVQRFILLTNVGIMSRNQLLDTLVKLSYQTDCYDNNYEAQVFK